MKIKTKNAKNGVMSTVNLALHIQRFNIEDTKERSQIRVMEVKKLHKERHYEGSHILFIESRAQSCIYRFVLAFLPFILDVRFGKILNIASYMSQ